MALAIRKMVLARREPLLADARWKKGRPDHVHGHYPT